MLKQVLGGTAPDSVKDLSHSLLRIGTGLMMAFLHGAAKMPPSDKFIVGVSELGFPAPAFFAWCAALAEMGGGLLLAAGLLTRPASFFIAFTMFVAAFGRHLHDPFARKELSLLYLLLALYFLVRGGGRWSIDRLLWGSKR